MHSLRWKVLAGMTLGVLVGFLLARLIAPERDGSHDAAGRRPAPTDVSFDSARNDLPILSLGEEAFFDDDLPTIHAEAIEVVADRDGSSAAADDAAPPDTLPNPALATPIDVHNQDAEKLLRGIIDEELTGVSEADRKVWFDVLRGLSEKEARDILQIWKITGFPREPSVTSEALALPAPPASPVQPSASPHDAAIRAAVAVNLAHLHDPGYRRLDARLARAEEDCPLDLTPGEVVTTHNPLHIAIEGEGYFALASGDETACTRCGTFDLSDDGELIQRHHGRDWVLQPPVRLPKDAVQLEVAEDGVVSCRTAADAGPQPCGRIQLVTCVNPQRLRSLDGSLLRPTPRSGTLQPLPPAQTHVRQGHLEQSNASMEGEHQILELLRVLHAFEFASQPK